MEKIVVEQQLYDMQISVLKDNGSWVHIEQGIDIVAIKIKFIPDLISALQQFLPKENLTDKK